MWGNGMKYAKPPLSIDQQLDQLVGRGLQIPDRASAAHYLRHLNYYRLCAYWLPLEEDHNTHRFKSGASFETVLNHYLFDRELRLLLLDTIERIEISVRTQWAHHFSLQYGAHAHLDASLFKPHWDHAGNLQRLQQSVAHSKETFIKHLRETYDEALPPLWALVEIMSIGQLSKWVANLRHGRDRNRIARVYGFDETNLMSFLHHLSVVRNLCAHHNRLWNREFTFTFKLPKKTPRQIPPALNRQQNRKLYNTLVVVVRLLDIISPNHHFRQHLATLLKKYTIDEHQMGFPPRWRDMPFWHTQGEINT